MQTFLPYADFAVSASVLDRQRLGKQRVENLQIMNALVGGKGWENHPAVHQWAGYEDALIEYQRAIIREWTEVRGYKDTCWSKTLYIYGSGPFIPANTLTPWWLGIEDYHLSHQSNLIRKDPEHYGPLFPGVPDDLPYYWPTQQMTPYG